MTTITPKDINKSITLASDIARPGIMPALSHIVIGNGQIISSDLENQITIAAPFDFEPYMVPAAKFKSILGTLPDDVPLKLEHKDGVLMVKSGKSKFKIQTLPADQFPVMELGEPKSTMELDQSMLKKMLHDVQHAMADKHVQQWANGLLLEVNESQLTVVATDGPRLAKSTQPFQGVAPAIIIPRNTVHRLQKILNDGPVTVNLYDGKAEFIIGDNVLLTKLIDTKYPDYRRILPSPKNKVLVDREIFVEAFNRSAVVLEKNRAAQVSIGAMLSVTCQNNGEVASDEFEFPYAGPVVDIGLNPDYMRDAMAAIGGDEVTFGFTDGKSAVTLEGEGLFCVVMQLRI
jgi:DNA polymerase-3 subunit beta